MTFSEPVTGFDAGDLVRGGDATGGTVAVSGSGASYEITLDGSPTNGTVSFSLGAGSAHDAAGNGNAASTSTDNTITYDTVAPSVKLEQKPGQADPTDSLPIRFTLQFSEPVADFDASDVSLGGTAGGGSVSVTGSGRNYEIGVSGLSSDGTVTASVDAGKAHDAAGNPSSASTSTDNSVTYDATAPTVTVEQKAGQADPTKVLPLRWTVTFSEPVSGFDAGDLTRGGTSTGGTVDVTGSGASYEIALSGTPTNGTVSFAVGPNRAQDAAGNGNTASTSTDNTVSYDTRRPDDDDRLQPVRSERIERLVPDRADLHARRVGRDVGCRLHRLRDRRRQPAGLQRNGRRPRGAAHRQLLVDRQRRHRRDQPCRAGQGGHHEPGRCAVARGVAAPIGAFLSPDNVLLFKGDAPGSFTLLDAPTDATSGIASTAFPAVSTTDWLGLGGADTSSPFTAAYSWNATTLGPRLENGHELRCRRQRLARRDRHLRAGRHAARRSRP